MCARTYTHTHIHTGWLLAAVMTVSRGSWPSFALGMAPLRGWAEPPFVPSTSPCHKILHVVDTQEILVE